MWTKEKLNEHWRKNKSSIDNIKNNEQVWRARAMKQPNTNDGREAILCAQWCREFLIEEFGDYSIPPLNPPITSSSSDTDKLMADLLGEKTPVWIKE